MCREPNQNRLMVLGSLSSFRTSHLRRFAQVLCRVPSYLPPTTADRPSPDAANVVASPFAFGWLSICFEFRAVACSGSDLLSERKESRESASIIFMRQLVRRVTMTLGLIALCSG